MDKTFDNDKHYDENGDLLASRGQRFRQVGWQINGGVNDGFLIKLEDRKSIERLKAAPHGGFSPVYVEVGTD